MEKEKAKKPLNWEAENLLRLVKSHKSVCTGHCEISLFPLLKIFEQLKGSKATQKEFTNFM